MKETSNIKKLKDSVLKVSNSKDWDEAKMEWKCIYVKTNEDGVCACGHALNNLYYIQNKITSSTLIVGSTCVNKFKDKEMDAIVKRTNDKIKRAVKDAKYYQELMDSQLDNNIPISLPKNEIESGFTSGALNDFEYNFYMNIWSFRNLSEKQSVIKNKINSKLNKKRLC